MESAKKFDSEGNLNAEGGFIRGKDLFEPILSTLGQIARGPGSTPGKGPILPGPTFYYYRLL